jgi:hypothetical protein
MIHTYKIQSLLRETELLKKLVEVGTYINSIKFGSDGGVIIEDLGEWNHILKDETERGYGIIVRSVRPSKFPFNRLEDIADNILYLLYDGNKRVHIEQTHRGNEIEVKVIWVTEVVPDNY